MTQSNVSTYIIGLNLFSTWIAFFWDVVGDIAMSHDFLGEEGWHSGESARLPPMCPGFDSWTQRHILLWEVFLRELRFSPLLKTNIWFDLIYLIYSLPN